MREMYTDDFKIMAFELSTKNIFNCTAKNAVICTERLKNV